MKRTVSWRNKFFSVGMIIFLTLFIAACGSGGWGSVPPPHPSGTSPTITSADNTIFTVGTAGTFTVTATGDPAPTFALTGTLPTGVTFDTTTGVLSGTPAAGTNGTYPLTITASNGISPDATQNFSLTVSTLPPFNTSSLPLTVTGSTAGFGSFAFDANGNLLFEVPWLDEIRLLDRITGTVTTVAASGTFGGDNLLGMTYDKGSIFVGGNNGNIYQVDPATGTQTVLTNISAGAINGLVIAPATYGSYGGQLIVATYSGNIYAVDQSVPSPTPVLIANIGGSSASALIFGSDGTLYVANYSTDKILTVTAAGVVADFVTAGLSGPDGLAFDTTGGILYVANSDDYTLKSVTIPGGIVSTITSFQFDSGWYPSPIIYDVTSNILLLGTRESGTMIIYNYNL